VTGPTTIPSCAEYKGPNYTKDPDMCVQEMAAVMGDCTVGAVGSQFRDLCPIMCKLCTVALSTTTVPTSTTAFSTTTFTGSEDNDDTAEETTGKPVAEESAGNNTSSRPVVHTINTEYLAYTITIAVVFFFSQMGLLMHPGDEEVRYYFD